jgi:hypothetical protein
MHLAKLHKFPASTILPSSVREWLNHKDTTIAELERKIIVNENTYFSPPDFN